MSAKSNSRCIVALDVNSLEEAKQIVDELGDSVSFYKVGMQFYYSQGNEVLRYLQSKNKSIFLDLKLHDIPNTVAKSAAALSKLGVSLMTLHSLGGFAMMQAAAQAVKESAAAENREVPKLLAVTILTSMDEAALKQVGCPLAIGEEVLTLAKLAKAAGMDGVVASPHEAAMIRKACGDDFLIVTPGIRPAGAALQDQSRASTPAAALAAGATHLVIGRPITQAADKNLAVEKILAEMETV
ncbi:MAG: orotidine-5'-phosphate decarboxylase [Sporomusaceae bacterium]|nr:orotidine-5'-phosphate decarboxylase [Sporomusaceae bacterium]